MRKLPALTAVAVSAALVGALSACGSSEPAQSSSPTPAGQSASSAQASLDPAAVDAVSIEEQDGGKKLPKVSVGSAITDSAGVGVKLVNPGDGKQVQEGQTIKARMASFDPKTGKPQEQAAEQYKEETDIPVDEDQLKQLPGLFDTLKQAKVGADIAYYVPASLAGKPQLTVLHITDTQDPKPAATTWTKSSSDSPSEPEAHKNDHGGYDVTIPQGKAPEKLQKKVITEGKKGKAATEKSTVTAQYSGSRWDDAKEFDGNFGDKPTSFELNQVIAGWKEGLKGYKAGTVVLLTIPEKQAYGPAVSDGKAASGGPGGPLVFIVKIDKVS